jgi:hypothetical protein
MNRKLRPNVPDRRDEVLMMIFVILIPLFAIPAMLGV